MSVIMKTFLDWPACAAFETTAGMIAAVPDASSTVRMINLLNIMVLPTWRDKFPLSAGYAFLRLGRARGLSD